LTISFNGTGSLFIKKLKGEVAMSGEELSVKNTKNQILTAYEDALKEIREMKSEDRKQVKERQEKASTVQSALSNTVENIVKNLGVVKLEVAHEFEGIESKLVSEYKRLETIERAIQIETQNVKELYEINRDADSLSALLRAQEDKRNSFESEIKGKREVWEKEASEQRAEWEEKKTTHELATKEQAAQIQKQRKREEEEYSYTQSVTRKKEQDEYLAQKKTLEKELTDKKALVEQDLAQRQKAVLEKEQEFLRLQKEVEAFPKRLEAELANREKRVCEQLEIGYKHSTELSGSQMEGERKLSSQKIEALEEKIKTQIEQIRELTSKASQSTAQVQDIAVKAIEGAAATTFSQRQFNERMTNQNFPAPERKAN
jgi:hypothetical protein